MWIYLTVFHTFQLTKIVECDAGGKDIQQLIRTINVEWESNQYCYILHCSGDLASSTVAEIIKIWCESPSGMKEDEGDKCTANLETDRVLQLFSHTALQKSTSTKQLPNIESYLVKLPLSTVDPGYRDVLQDHHHSERQTSGVVIKHSDKVVPRTLHKQQA